MHSTAILMAGMFHKSHHGGICVRSTRACDRLYSWDIGNVQTFSEFGTTDAFYNAISSIFEPTVTMDLTAWAAPPPNVVFDYGSCG